MIKISVNKQSERGVLDSLKAMTLPRKKRVHMLGRAAKTVVRTSRKNQRGQKTPGGKRWEKKKGKRRGRKMMSGLSKYMSVISNDGSMAVISWKSAKSAKVAYMHHHGIKERVSRAKAIKAQNG